MICVLTGNDNEPSNVSFENGEDWILDATMHDSAGEPLDISSAQVRWRLALNNDVLTELTVGSGITLINGGTTGECLIHVTPANQVTLGIAPNFYQHAAQVILSDGTVTNQFAGYLQVLPSLFDE